MLPLFITFVMLSCPSRLTSLASLSAITALLVASCGDTKSTNAEAPSAMPSASAAPSAAPTSTASASATAVAEPPPSESLPPDAVDTTAAPAEAQRKTLRAVADDPAFYANRNFFAEKYGGARLPLPLSLQAVPLPRGRRALLVTGQGAALEKPLIVVVEADHSIAWSKDRPLAGPTITVLKGEVVEVTVGPRKIKISRDGAVTPGPDLLGPPAGHGHLRVEGGRPDRQLAH